MTCIVGYKNKGMVYIGGDSAGVGGLDITPRKDVKVFRNKDFIIGYTSSFRMGQLLRYKFNPPATMALYENEEDPVMSYMVQEFVEKARKIMKEGGYSEVDKNVETGGAFLVAYRDRLFTVYSDFQVSESLRHYEAVGCGADYALGTLHYADRYDNLAPPRTKVWMALQTAAEFSAGVCPPYHILGTDGSERFEEE